MADASAALRARSRACKQDHALADKRAHVARQEEAVRHLAAVGHSTALAEKRLAALRRGLDAMLERRRNRVERQAGAATGDTGEDAPPPGTPGPP